jgi:GMP reductase
MLGGMLAGHDEGGGNVIVEHHQTTVMEKHITKKFVEFYGMSSETAMDKHHGGIADYRSSEGRTVRVPYKGEVTNTVRDILGGLRSSCTYVGAPSLKQLSKCTTFVRVNKQYNDVFVK